MAYSGGHGRRTITTLRISPHCIHADTGHARASSESGRSRSRRLPRLVLLVRHERTARRVGAVAARIRPAERRRRGHRAPARRRAARAKAAVNIPPQVVERCVRSRRARAWPAWPGSATSRPHLQPQERHDRRRASGAKAVDANAAVAIPIHDASGEIRGVVGIAYMGERDITQARARSLRRRGRTLLQQTATRASGYSRSTMASARVGQHARGPAEVERGEALAHLRAVQHRPREALAVECRGPRCDARRRPREHALDPARIRQHRRDLPARVARSSPVRSRAHACAMRSVCFAWCAVDRISRSGPSPARRTATASRERRGARTRARAR